jgi:hypothetical protein
MLRSPWVLVRSRPRWRRAAIADAEELIDLALKRTPPGEVPRAAKVQTLCDSRDRARFAIRSCCCSAQLIGFRDKPMARRFNQYSRTLRRERLFGCKQEADITGSELYREESARRF